MAIRARHLQIYYPSGNQVSIFGRPCHDRIAPEFVAMYVIAAEPTLVGGQVIPFDAALVIDPRAVVRDTDTDEIISHPRHAPDEAFSAELRLWMDEHPEWPSILELEGV